MTTFLATSISGLMTGSLSLGFGDAPLKILGDFVTPRHIAIIEYPAHSLFGYPGQDLVWPGVFVLGHPATSPAPLIPGTPSPSVPAWSRNGSYLVFRRLRQDVGLFWKMRSEAKRLSALPGFDDMTDEKLASRFVGRWPSGAPVNRVPEQDNPKLGETLQGGTHSCLAMIWATAFGTSV